MPPRYAYWTIMAGGLPTAFRAVEREELLPTFNRLKDKHPDAELKYFARGRLWSSPDEARRDAEARRAGARRPVERRGRDWRPGGEHQDPRQKFKDAKKDRNQDWRKQRFERRQRSGEDKGPADRSGRAPDRPQGTVPERKPFGGPPRGGAPRDRKPFDGTTATELDQHARSQTVRRSAMDRTAARSKALWRTPARWATPRPETFRQGRRGTDHHAIGSRFAGPPRGAGRRATAKPFEDPRG